MNRTLIPIAAILIVTFSVIGAAYAYSSQFQDEVGQADIISNYGSAGIYSDDKATDEINRITFDHGVFAAFLRYIDNDSSTSEVAVELELNNLDADLVGKTITFTLDSETYKGKVFHKDADYRCLINGITIDLTDGTTGIVGFNVNCPSDPGHASLKISIYHYA